LIKEMSRVKQNFDVINNGTLNKGMAFTKLEREKLGLRGIATLSCPNSGKGIHQPDMDNILAQLRGKPN
jgi:hypothetical protein